MIVVICHLAIEAVVTFVMINMTIGMNGLYLAFIGAELAGLATFFAAFQPVEQAGFTWYCQGSTQRTDITAVDFARKNIDNQQQYSVENKAPFAAEFEHDGGFKGFHFGISFCGRK